MTNLQLIESALLDLGLAKADVDKIVARKQVRDIAADRDRTSRYMAFARELHASAREYHKGYGYATAEAATADLLVDGAVEDTSAHKAVTAVVKAIASDLDTRGKAIASMAGVIWSKRKGGSQ